MGSGVIVNNTHFRDYFYIFTAKHIFFESNSKVIDMNSDSIIKKKSLGNLTKIELKKA